MTRIRCVGVIGQTQLKLETQPTRLPCELHEWGHVTGGRGLWLDYCLLSRPSCSGQVTKEWAEPETLLGLEPHSIECVCVCVFVSGVLAMFANVHTAAAHQIMAANQQSVVLCLAVW